MFNVPTYLQWRVLAFMREPPKKSSSPRVGIITPGFPGHDDSWFAPPVSETIAALARVIPVSVLSLYYPRVQQSYSWRGVNVVALGCDETTRMGRSSAIRAAIQWALTSAFAPNVFLGIWATEPGLAAVLAARISRRPALVYLAGGELAHLPHLNYGDSRHWDRRLWIRQVLARADRVICPSQWLAEYAQPWVQHAPSAQLPWGIVTGTRTTFAVRDSSVITLCTVAALLPVKGIDTLLDAFALAQDRRLRLRIVGDGSERGRLCDRARNLGVADRVDWIGFVPHNQMAEQYAAADLLVHPSWWEAQGVVVLEAMAAGLPVISTVTGAAPEAIRLTDSGLLVPPGDVPALAQTIQAMVGDLPGWTHRAAHGAPTIQAQWSVTARAQALADLLHSFC